MTENVREEMLKDIKDGYIDEWSNLTIDELFEQIEREHNEIQQYKTIGTVEQFKALKENSFFNFDSPLVRVDKKSYDKAIDEFADKMIIMMPGHRQDIEQIAEQMKGE